MEIIETIWKEGPAGKASFVLTRDMTGSFAAYMIGGDFRVAGDIAATGHKMTAREAERVGFDCWQPLDISNHYRR